MRKQSTNASSKSRVHWEHLEESVRQQVQQLIQAKPESTEGRPWGQPLKKPEGAPLNLR